MCSLSPLAYHRISDLAELLHGVDLRNLVAVFTQSTGSQCLFVYLASSPQNLSHPVRVITLGDLADQELVDFDGPTVAFSAIDVVRHDIPTKGPGFYAIDHLFQKREAYAQLNETRRNLACYLVQHLAELSPEHKRVLQRRAVTKVLQLSLTATLADRPCENLVAALPTDDLDRVAAGQGWRFVYNDPSHPDDLHGWLDASNAWVVALEEATLLQPALQPKDSQLLELRDVLRDANQAASLRTTCRNLAMRCYQWAESEPDFLEMAVSLMAEVWLSVEDTDDLVAFFPHCDFLHFAETGEAIRIYRRMAEGDAAGIPAARLRRSLSTLSRGDIPREYGKFALSLLSPPSAALHPGVRLLDLGAVLWKAGQGQSLARTFCLLVGDWLRMPEAARSELGMQPEVLADLATRAVVLYGLGDPWQWRQGRHELFLEGCYDNLKGGLALNAETVGDRFASYYHALIGWYDCYPASDKTHDNLQEAARLFKDFLSKTQDLASRPHLDACRTNARRLAEIAEIALHSLAGVGPPRPHDSLAGIKLVVPPTGVPDVLCAASARPKQPPAVLSSLFDHCWNILLDLCHARRQLQSRQQDVDVLLRQYKELAGDFERHRNQIFALPHETAVLHFAYQQEIEHLQRLISGLESSAILEVELKNRWLDFNAEPDLYFEVANIGHVAASDVEVVLVQDSSFELLEGMSVRTIPYLSPGASETVTYPVRPLQPELTLRLSYVYWGQNDQKREGSRQFRPEVRNLELLPFKHKVNRYEFGRPIQQPGDFFGRRKELFDILSSLQAGGRQNVLLRGPRRMGKTSLLYMIQRSLDEPRARRLFDIPPAWDHQLGQISPVLITLQSVDLGARAAVNQFFRTLLERIGGALALEKEVIQDIAEAFVSRSSEVGAANAALEQLDALLLQRPGRRVVVLLDEYDEVYRPQGHDLDTALRTVVAAEQRLTWIIASTLGLYKESKSVGSPWFNVFLIYELDRLSEKAAQDLVQIPSRGERVYWRSDAVLELLRETGRHPAFIQLFCSKLISHLNQARANYVLNSTITTLANQIVEEQETAHSHFEFYWSDTSGVGKLILLIVDDSPAPLKRVEIRRQLQERLEKSFAQRPSQRIADQGGNLVEWRELQFKDGMDWVDKVSNAISSDQQHFRFTVELFHRWLRRRRQREDLLQEALDCIAADMEKVGLG